MEIDSIIARSPAHLDATMPDLGAVRNSAAV
jgi:hypothetical protein